MVQKETMSVNGKEITVYNVMVSDKDGNTVTERGITDSSFDVLLPDGYDSDREEYKEEYLFDGEMDFYLPDEVVLLSDEGIVSYLNKNYGDEERVFTNN